METVSEGKGNNRKRTPSMNCNWFDVSNCKRVKHKNRMGLVTNSQMGL